MVGAGWSIEKVTNARDAGAVFRRTSELVIIEVAVLILVAQAHLINRLAGLPYPLWSYRGQPEST